MHSGPCTAQIESINGQDSLTLLKRLLDAKRPATVEEVRDAILESAPVSTLEVDANV
jgi:hypothetical protein